jgi:hypothetical protein
VAIDIKKKFLPVRTRTYLNKDFDSLRAQLLDYAQTFYPDRIADFSEASVGGMFLDFVSMVGDTLSFYLDHQFAELNPETAIETQNIERLIRTSGIKITGAASAVVTLNFTIEVPVVRSGASYIPRPSAVPNILAGTIAVSQSGVHFELLEDIDFAETDRDGDLVATVVLSTASGDGTPTSFSMTLSTTCMSGKMITEKFTFSNSFVPFRSLTLSKPNVSEILSVRDSMLNTYYEVTSLTQDNVFVALTNVNIDRDFVKENMELTPAPYRFVTQTSFRSKKTKLNFGSGDANALDDDIVPDPSEFAVPLYGKKNFSRFSIDPNSLLRTRTLGISPQNTTLTVAYRHGGGLSHNVPANSIRTISTLLIKFTRGAGTNEARTVQASLKVTNPHAAGGGENPPTLDELKAMIPASRNAQSRIVTKADLLARVYTMPSNFGRVYRASVRSNPNNPLATQLFIISRNAKGALIISPDTLKKNLVLYLNEFRMISDAVDILDAAVVDIQVRFKITVAPNANKTSVVQQVISKLKQYFQLKNFQIDQVIPISDLQNIIFNTQDVLTLTNLKLYGLNGTYQSRIYSDIVFNPNDNTIKGMIVPPIGAIFQVRYPNVDIIGSAD